MYALRFVSLLSSAALLASCANAVDVDHESDWMDEGLTTNLAPVPSGAHIMPMQTHPRFLRDGAVGPGGPGAAGATKLDYFGGPVIANAKVITIHWGTGVLFADKIDAFYKAILQSTHMDWLKEYNTPTQSIGRGQFVTRYVDTGVPSGKTVSDDQLRAELKKLIDGGKVPKSDGDTLYMFHFPPGVSVTMGTDASCSTFCAYHNTDVDAAGKFVYYGVIPDMGGNCAFGCGFNSQDNNTTSVASHELIEAVTDAAVGQAQDYAFPLAWYDKAGGQGEIGDICNGQQGTIAGYTIQLEWSNEKSGCIAEKAGTTPADEFSVAVAPGSQTVKAGSSTTFTVSTSVVSGSPGTVALSVSGLPTGATASWDKSSVAAGGSATLTIATAASTAAGTSTLTITAKSTGATHPAAATLVVQAGGSTGGAIVNGAFEAGDRSGWQSDGTKVWATQRRVHGGVWAGKVGSSLGFKGKNGLYQLVSAGSTSKLDFYYYVRCNGTIATDHAQALITDGNGNVLQTVFDKCTLDTGWTHATVDLSKYAGQTVGIYFQAIDDGDVNTATYMYVDDVALAN